MDEAECPPPTGWKRAKTHSVFGLAPGRQLPLPEADAALWQSLAKNTEPAAGKAADMLFPDRPSKRDDFYSELCSKRSRGLARVWTLEREGNIICTVGAYALANGQAYMACGETVEALRGKGVGGRLIVEMANALAAEGWMPVFLCSPERVHFYTRLGFEKMGVESTGASVFNINAIMAGDLEFGIAQADRQYQAYNGLSEWEGKPQKDLRAVFALAPEAVTFVAAEDSGIKSLKDAKGKVVNIGNPGSGNRQNAIDVFEAAGINIEKDLKAESIKAADAPRMLQDGRIDGFFYTVGHPNGNIKEATAGKRKTRIVSITDIEPLVKKFPYYSLTNIDMAQYPEATNANEKVTTVGMLATFVTSAKVPDDVVYAITKEVFENLDEFKKLHPALEGLTRETMLEGLTAPIHPGALKYYKEAGLMK